MGWASSSRRRRPPEEVARIKAERLRKEEDEILARADAIRTRRAEKQDREPGLGWTLSEESKQAIKNIEDNNMYAMQLASNIIVGLG